MSPGELLNSDLPTLGRELRRGFDWWIEELNALIPASWARLGKTKASALRFDGIAGFIDLNDAKQRRSSVISVDRVSVLTRSIATPRMARADFERMLVLNGERYLPLRSSAFVLASAIQAERGDDGMMVTDLAAMPVAMAQALAGALRAHSIEPQSVRLVDAGGALDPRFDFLPAMRAGGMLDARSNRALAWWLAAFAMAALYLATMIWRDRADVDRLQALVDAQRPAAAIGQRMTAQMQTAQRLANDAVARRAQHDVLGVLAAATAAVPNGAWVQRYAWDGATLRLTGYRARDADVAAALRNVPAFANVKSSQTDTVAEMTAGQPFDLVAEVRTRRP